MILWRDVCQSVWCMRSTQTAKRIEVQFKIKTRVGAKNVLYGGPDPPIIVEKGSK